MMQAHFAPARENLSTRENPSRLSRSLSGVNRPRSSESWIEVPSQASSSQASSLHGDEPRRHPHTLPNDPLARRRRRLLRNAASSPVQTVQTLQARTNSTATSSQEEYEESDSASDRILTSSNENLSHPSEGSSPINIVSPPPLPQSSQHGEEEDDDENATALGIGTHDRVFTPPANAFSHPPHPSTTTTTLRQRQVSSLETRTTTSYFPSQPQRRPSFASNTTSRPSPRTSAPRSSGNSHTPYNMISPSHRADHDAALRASLSTLLSCARAMPKRSSDNDTKPPTRTTPLQSHQHPQSNRIAPSTLTLIPPGSDPSIPNSSDAEKPSSRRQRQRSPTAKPKRKSSSPTKDHDRAATRTKPPRQTASSADMADGTMQLIHPTLLTWVVSAGVVVLFSAIGFSAGYVIGREVGRVDVMDVARGGGAKQMGVGRGLRRLGRAGGAVVRVA